MCNKVALLANILSKTPVLLQSSIDLCFTHTPSVLEIEIVTIEIDVKLKFSFIKNNNNRYLALDLCCSFCLAKLMLSCALSSPV